MPVERSAMEMESEAKLGTVRTVVARFRLRYAGVAIAILGGAFVGWRILESEAARAEREVRDRWQNRATEGALLLNDVLSDLERRARDRNDDVWIQEENRFVKPPEPARFRAAAPVRGRDTEGDFLLATAESAIESDLERALDLLRVAKLPERDPTIRVLASIREFGVLRRLERDEEALQSARDSLASSPDAERRETRELLLLRTEVERDTPEWLADLLRGIGGPEEAFARACLSRSAAPDRADAIAKREREVARIREFEAWLASAPPQLPGRAIVIPSSDAISVAVTLDERTRAFATEPLVLGSRIPPEFRLVRGDDRAHELAARSPVGERLPGFLIEVIGSSDELSSTIRARASVVAAALLLVGAAVFFALRNALRSANRERELAQRQTAFVARVGHDLRTPLALIRMYAETIAGGRVEEPAQVREFASIAARESERLTRMVTNVLDFSRVSESSIKAATSAIDLRPLVESLVAIHRPLFDEANMRVTVVGAHATTGNRDALTSLLSNLIENALHHASSGGVLEIEITGRGERVELRFADRGPGMSDEFMRRAFQRFVRGDDARSRGTGLGLALVREIAESHGGSARIERRDGGGLVVCVDLPAAVEQEVT